MKEPLADINRHPFLSRVLVLKGGTALNFGFGKPRRLSVDLDFNYIGALERSEVEHDRTDIAERMGKHLALLWKAENAAAHARRRRNR